MTRALGARVVIEDEARREDRGGSVGEARRQRIDEEIDRILAEETTRCESLLRENLDLHKALYTLLLERKVLDASALRTLIHKE
jgi:ATP-dependent Zn protease